MEKVYVTAVQQGWYLSTDNQIRNSLYADT